MWTKEKLEEYISNKIEENKHLEYKSANSIGKSDKLKTEISKDISSIANSDGGIIIYGIKEYDEDELKNLPERIDPIDRLLYPKEWLENVISGNIVPIINDLKIFPVTIDDSNNLVAYVIDIGKSTTAHQACDNRYYKRRNFKASPMEDWEVKDVINRANKPIIDIYMYSSINTGLINYLNGAKYEIQIVLKNIGSIGAQHIECFVEFDLEFKKYILHPRPSNLENICQVSFNNRKENKIKIGDTEAVISVYNEPLLADVWRGIGKFQVHKDIGEKDCKVKCYVTTEYGLTTKEFNLKEIVNKK